VVARWQKVVNDESYPARMAMYYNPGLTGESPAETIERVRALQGQGQGSESLRFPGIKLILDGSIQGFTARLGPPGYYRSDEQGLFVIDPEVFPAMVREYHRAGINVHVHCNGDEATGLFLDAVDAALREYPWLDHRHTVEHCQTTRPEQYQRMARLGMAANIFSNHLWYWGDQHYEVTLGPERARAMDACGTAAREGVRFSIHSDASVTPLGHLHTMWCAVNRLTPSGRILGEDERISPQSALHAVTLGSAYQLHLDAEFGTIECGKAADFSVLEDNPLTVDPMAIRDIGIWGTVVAGRPLEAAHAS
jgi:predicted amidohydrolase YtcJ